MTACTDLELTSKSLSFVNKTEFLVLTQVVTDAYLIVLMWRSHIAFLVGTMFANLVFQQIWLIQNAYEK